MGWNCIIDNSVYKLSKGQLMGYDNNIVWTDSLLYKPWYIEYLPIIISFIGLLLVIAGWAVTNHLNMKLQKRKLYYDSLIVVKNEVIA